MLLRLLFSNQRYNDNERESSASCVGGSALNFYNDEAEAQELVLEEDRLTFRHTYSKKSEEKHYNNGIFDDN